jgi:hypothetical protein
MGAVFSRGFTLRVLGRWRTHRNNGAPADGKIDVPADGSQTMRVTLTGAPDHDLPLRFIARDETGRVFAAKDHFVTR